QEPWGPAVERIENLIEDLPGGFLNAVLAHDGDYESHLEALVVPGRFDLGGPVLDFAVELLELPPVQQLGPAIELQRVLLGEAGPARVAPLGLDQPESVPGLRDRDPVDAVVLVPVDDGGRSLFARTVQETAGD